MVERVAQVCSIPSHCFVRGTSKEVLQEDQILKDITNSIRLHSTPRYFQEQTVILTLPGYYYSWHSLSLLVQEVQLDVPVAKKEYPNQEASSRDIMSCRLHHRSCTQSSAQVIVLMKLVSRNMLHAILKCLFKYCCVM
eukprot:gb/GECG01005571.1/.p1 GENE.gb/GECG01005571.1/~~gb/GECG01005571.1/.p1  ORF type:complete len:138 (+),score=13.44 gb/GECG01005571.1/:1-414(+)